MNLLLLQIADSAFPVGGFAHSSGLESAFALGELDSLAHWVERHLRAVGRNALPFVHAAHRRPHEAAITDQACEAFLSQHVARRASKTQGRAFIAACVRSFAIAAPPVEHFAPAFGACLQALGVSEADTRLTYMHGALRGALSAAVRLGLCGPYASQQLQHRLSALASSVCEQSAGFDCHDAAQIDPLLELFQGQHDRLYSRLFQS